jgi:hypothetical protein
MEALKNREYKKSLDDEIDWKVIDQLHAATVGFSTTSLELKKIFLVLLGIAVPTLLKLAGDQLDLSFFVTIYLLICTFWFLDAFTYFYQEKLREKMDLRFNSLRTRNSEGLVSSNGKRLEFTIEVNRTYTGRLRRSILNYSLWIYYLFFMLNTLAFMLYKAKLI